MSARGVRATALAVLAAAVLAGCGGEPGTGTDDPHGPAADGAKALASFAVPPAYDGAKGWDESLPWVPGDDPVAPVAVVPGGGAVALLTLDGAGFAVKSRAVDGGGVRWTSATWRPPVPMEDAKEKNEIPALVGLEQDGRKFVVVAAHGLVGKDDLHEGTEVIRLAVYDAGAKGAGRKPLREIDVPVRTEEGDWRVSADGARLLVAYGESGPYPRFASAVDVITGKVTAYDQPTGLLKQCEGQSLACDWGRVVAAGAQGPLVGLGQGFGVPGAWFSEAVRPEGADAKDGGLGVAWNGDVYGVAAGRFLAQWHRTGKDGSSGPAIWSVHEVGSGALLARTDCGYDAFPTITSQGNLRDYPVVASPSGRFLAAGPVAFDLERKQGVCLQGDGNRKTVTVSTVGDDGIAYGQVDDSAAPLPVRLDLTTATGGAKVLGAGVELPQRADLGGAGLFVVRDKDRNIRVSVRAAR
ncbi:hypothetical protein ACFYU9_05000 [Streptomyces sp. NPDC004327]|uniref:hypothetical protein n=1 Tax=Streptomyces sp. NPDC004327 TaxID=3364699 RepID=UPI0036CDA7AE